MTKESVNINENENLKNRLADLNARIRDYAADVCDNCGWKGTSSCNTECEHYKYGIAKEAQDAEN